MYKIIVIRIEGDKNKRAKKKVKDIEAYRSKLSEKLNVEKERIKFIYIHLIKENG